MLLCVRQVLEVEREQEVRRAAVLVVKATLSGLGQDTTKVSVTPGGRGGGGGGGGMQLPLVQSCMCVMVCCLLPQLSCSKVN